MAHRIRSAAGSSNMCKNCGVLQKFPGHDYCGKTCAAEAGKQKKAPPQRASFPKPPSPVVSSPFAQYNSFREPDRSESPEWCENCYTRPKSKEKDEDGVLITHPYCGIRCALAFQSSTLPASNIPAPVAGTFSNNPSNLILERFRTPIGRSILLMMQGRWQSDELGRFQLKSVYRIGLSEDVYRRFDLALQTNDGCPVTATYYGCVATCSIVDDTDPAACGSGSCELCDVLRSSFGNLPYGASSRDGIYGPGLYTYKNPALAHIAMISDGGQQSQDTNHALIQCRVVTQGNSGPGSTSFASFTDDAGVTFCAQSTAIIPTHLLIYSLDAPPDRRRVSGSANADMASISPVASAATPASEGLDQPKSSSNTATGAGQAKSKTAKGKAKGRAKGPLPDPPLQNEPTKPLSATSSDQQTGHGGTGSDSTRSTNTQAVNQTVPMSSSPSPPIVPAPRSRSSYPPAAQIQTWLAPNVGHPGPRDASQGGPAPETFVPPRAPSPPPAPVLSPPSRGLFNPPPPVFGAVEPNAPSPPHVSVLSPPSRGLLNPPPPVFRALESTADKDLQSTPLPPSLHTQAWTPGSTGPVPQGFNQPNLASATPSYLYVQTASGLVPIQGPAPPGIPTFVMGPDGVLQPFQPTGSANVVYQQTPASNVYPPGMANQGISSTFGADPATAALRALTMSNPPGGWPSDPTTNTGSPPNRSSSPPNDDDGAHGVQSSSREVSLAQLLKQPNTNGKDHAALKESSGRSDLSPDTSPLGPRRPGSVSHEPNHGSHQKATSQSSNPSTARVDDDDALDYTAPNQSSGRSDLSPNNSPPGSYRSASSYNTNRGGHQRATRQSSYSSAARAGGPIGVVNDDEQRSTGSAAGARKPVTRPTGPKAPMDEDDPLGAGHNDDTQSRAGKAHKSAKRSKKSNARARLDEDDK